MQIALIDGVPAVRHARQLMLRAEGFDVRTYASAVPLLADPLALATSCMVAEVAMPEIDGVALVQAMRGQGWQGAAILLAGVVSSALAALAIEQKFTVMVPTGLADRLLLAGIRTAIAVHSR
ncbi:response regulator [Sphingomonas sp. PAMC 26605]|uniref:response regulator n=1 Tax=Sphingomonas sp. PAMC 26605 TaxID=1112214 RepID=UPI00026CD241|nr:response regulator [Sphingomonas sp. PAMC 26605]